MKLRYVIILLISVLLVGYAIGQFVPWDLLHPDISNKEITINDYYTRLVSIIGAIATIFATFVALFKEDIRKIYENASLHVCFKDESKLTEVLNIESSTSSTHSVAATKYEVVIAIHNKGKLAAKGCQVYLEEIKYKHSSFPAPKELPISATPIEWIGKNENIVIIPSTGKGYINISEILPPLSEITSPDSPQTGKLNPRIRISGTEFAFDEYGGKYDCLFIIYSENSNPVEFRLEINWNGNWHPRLTEMKDCITIKQLNTTRGNA